jgi:hypothetical protein
MRESPILAASVCKFINAWVQERCDCGVCGKPCVESTTKKNAFGLKFSHDDTCY